MLAGEMRRRWGVRLAFGVVIFASAAGAGVMYRAMRTDSKPQLPDPIYPLPRSDVTAANVLSPKEVLSAKGYASTPDIARAYEVARQLPQLLDGLYCWCDCARHHGHRSLLSCFESEHGAACWVCVRQAIVAAEMHEQGKSLDEIRTAIDSMVRNKTLRA